MTCQAVLVVLAITAAGLAMWERSESGLQDFQGLTVRAVLAGLAEQPEHQARMEPLAQPVAA